MTLWNPSYLATPLTMWLDASDSSTITIDTGVSEWRDKSGNSNHAAQASASLQPTVVAAGLNGLDVLFFDGSAALLVSTITSPDTANTFIVWNKPASGASSYQRLFSAGDGTNYDYLANGPHELCPTASSGTAAGGPGLISNAWGGASKALTNFYIGRQTWTASQYYYGQVAEVIVAQAMSVDDFQLVEGYLAWKWGAQASLAIDHPFKDAAPDLIIETSVNSEAPTAETTILMTSLMAVSSESPVSEHSLLSVKVMSVNSSAPTSQEYCDTIITKLLNINSSAPLAEETILSAGNIVNESPTAENECTVINPTAITIASSSPLAETSIDGFTYLAMSIAQAAPCPEVAIGGGAATIINIASESPCPETYGVMIAEKHMALEQSAPCPEEVINMSFVYEADEIIRFRRCGLQ